MGKKITIRIFQVTTQKDLDMAKKEKLQKRN